MKNILKILPATCLLISLQQYTYAQQNDTAKMQWFADAKLGIFIHWGIYAVKGIPESWSFFNNYISYNDYMQQLEGFTAANYQPQKWASLIKESGAKYAVITTRHHDGVALWNTRQPQAISVQKNTSAKKDVLTPFIAALKKTGLKTGLYYSLPDWSYTDYDVFTSNIKRYNLQDNPARFEKFIQYYQAQLKELSANYHPDLLWFDGDWEHTAQEWKAAGTKRLLQQYNPNIIINARLTDQGDYATPEQGIPVHAPQTKYWELCYTMNDAWGYQPYDNNYKSANQLIRTLVECISMGGNLLLDIGPTADGTIPQEQVNILKALGRWTRKHAEAIYDTERGIDATHFAGKTALSKDKKSLYLYLSTQPNGWVLLKGIASGIKNISVIGGANKLSFTKEKENVWINVSDKEADDDVTVLKVTFDEPIKLTTPTKAMPFDINNLQAGHTFKSIKQLVNNIANGYNPYASNNVNVNSYQSLQNIKDTCLRAWMAKHAEVVGNAISGLPADHFAGNTSLSADKKTLYLFIEGSITGPVLVKGLNNHIARIRIVGDGTIINDYKIYDKLYWNSAPGLLAINIPKEKQDKYVTVLAILLDGPVSLYDGEVKAIEKNL